MLVNSYKAHIYMKIVDVLKNKLIQLCRLYILTNSYIKENGGIIAGSALLLSNVITVTRNHGIHGLLNIVISYSVSRRIPLLSVRSEFSQVNGHIVKPPPPLERHSDFVDIIICVHNALDDVQICLNSVLNKTNMPYSITLVDDGSGQETASFLKEFALQHSARLIRNNVAKGYTFAANQGLRLSTADYVVLLNSDTIVTSGWIDRLIACAASDQAIGIVGPLSNTASWQSIPEIVQDGDWASNPLPPPFSIEDMGRLVARDSARMYPRMPLLNGFCLLIKQTVLKQIGYFDEEAFGQGYGEENDYCLRARKIGWHLALADDTYIFHSQSRSYTNERRERLCQVAHRNLLRKHGHIFIDQSVSYCRDDRTLSGIRARAMESLARERKRLEARSRWEGRKVLFLLPVIEVGGGANVVIQEAAAMKEMGVDVSILNLERFRRSFEVKYPYAEHGLPVIFAKNERDIPRITAGFDAVIATANYSVGWLESLRAKSRRGYYIQDFEPYFYEIDSQEYRRAWYSYTLFPDLVRITKTDWNSQEVRSKIGVDCIIAGPSVDIDLFRPRPRLSGNWPQRPLQIAAMIRPSSARRGPVLTMEVLRDIATHHGPAVEIILFGCYDNEPDFVALATDFPWQNKGVLTRAESAWFLNEIDIFVDFSSFQAMGLTAMEAMACGAAVIVPENGGTGSYARHEINALVVDTQSQEACWSSLNRLIVDNDLRLNLQKNGIRDAVKFAPEIAAFNVLSAMFDNEQ
ncbi:MAG: glycosyltransferase [Desulfuromonadales bacterium]|nr:MAG: glycosyltransferase [Desulfuromonadales bacterium]